jgi:thymidylate synthase ThyX
MAKTFILDGTDVPHPEGMAVLQALYSRSSKSVLEQLPTVTQDRTETFISKHVIGYNHDSVLDAANIAIFVEGVSMFVAKALQDNQLYVGTECSTRYIDFVKQPFINPRRLGLMDLPVKSLEDQREFYRVNTPKVIEHNRARFPRLEGQSEIVYENALKAKTFDIMRGFLPAGATTNLCWIGRLSDVNARLQELRFHLLQEVKDLANTLIVQLAAKYPASCKLERMTDEVKAFIEAHATDYFYLQNYSITQESSLKDCWVSHTGDLGFAVFYSEEDANSTGANYGWLENRPKRAPIPKMPGHPGIEVSHVTDFGSFRDIQRHRNCVQKIPVLTLDLGFSSWYLDQLPDDIRKDARNHLQEVCGFVEKVENPFEAQYYIPMGYQVENVINMSIPQAVYMAELRSSALVHPTARRVGTDIANFLEEEYPFIKIYPDRSESEWNIRRGTQTITEK